MAKFAQDSPPFERLGFGRWVTLCSYWCGRPRKYASGLCHECEVASRIRSARALFREAREVTR